MRIRPERIAQSIHREVADILERRLRDPGLSPGSRSTPICRWRESS